MPDAIPETNFSSEALEDIGQAYDWYEERLPGLGEEFLRCLDACVQRIRRLPNSYPTVHADYRRALVRRFPYGVFFVVNGAKVEIFAVFHSSRQPDKWRSRVRPSI